MHMPDVRTSLSHSHVGPVKSSADHSPTGTQIPTAQPESHEPRTVPTETSGIDALSLSLAKTAKDDVSKNTSQGLSYNLTQNQSQLQHRPNEGATDSYQHSEYTWDTKFRRDSVLKSSTGSDYDDESAFSKSPSLHHDSGAVKERPDLQGRSFSSKQTPSLEHRYLAEAGPSQGFLNYKVCLTARADGSSVQRCGSIG